MTEDELALLPLAVVQDVFLYLNALELGDMRATSRYYAEICSTVAEIIVIRLAKKYYPHILYYNKENKLAVKRGVYVRSEGSIPNGGIFLLFRELSSHRIFISRGFVTFSLELGDSSDVVEHPSCRPHFRRCQDTRRDRGSFCNIFYRGEVYIIGTSSLVAAGTVEKYDFVTRYWANVQSLPRKFRSVAASVVQLPSLHSPRHHSTTSTNEVLYVVGGMDMLSLEVSDEIYRFRDDPIIPSMNQQCSTSSSSQSWILEDVRLNYARCNHTAITHRNKIWISGGTLESDKATNTVEIYDPVENTICIGPPMLCIRHCHHLVEVHGKIYVVGGDVDQLGNRLKRTIEVLIDDDDENPYWHHVTDFRDQRMGFCACSLSSKIYIFSGICKGELYERQLDTWDCFDVETGVWESDLSDKENKMMPLIDSWGQCVPTPSVQRITWSGWSDRCT